MAGALFYIVGFLLVQWTDAVSVSQRNSHDISAQVQLRRLREHVRESWGLLQANHDGQDVGFLQLHQSNSEMIRDPKEDDKPGLVKDTEGLLDVITGKQTKEAGPVAREDVQKQRETVAGSMKKLREDTAKAANEMSDLNVKHTKMSIDLDTNAGRLRALDAQLGLLGTESSKAAKVGELSALQKQYDDFSAKANALHNQYSQLRALRGAVYARMNKLHNEIVPLQSKADVQLRRALDVPTHGCVASLFRFSTALSLCVFSFAHSLSTASSSSRPCYVFVPLLPLCCQYTR